MAYTIIIVYLGAVLWRSSSCCCVQRAYVLLTFFSGHPPRYMLRISLAPFTEGGLSCQCTLTLWVLCIMHHYIKWMTIWFWCPFEGTDLRFDRIEKRGMRSLVLKEERAWQPTVRAKRSSTAPKNHCLLEAYCYAKPKLQQRRKWRKISPYGRNDKKVSRPNP